MPRCADAARERDDALAGTAPRGWYWVLIEHRGGWPVNGFDGLDLDPEVASGVFAAAQALRARILLIRRHGPRTREGPGSWAVLRLEGQGRFRQVWGIWEDDADLLQIPEALERCSRPGPVDEAAAEPVILVCAHGQHDVCCAIRGRPVAAALSERWPEQVWECTHVGGDRFAANVVVLPHGVYYGNLDANSATAVIEEHLEDRIGAEHLRGYTDLPPIAQAAVSVALRRDGPAGRFDYTVTSTSQQDALWTVGLRGRRPQQSELEIDLRVSRTAPRRLTCQGPQTSAALVYALEDVRVQQPGPGPGRALDHGPDQAPGQESARPVQDRPGTTRSRRIR